MRFHGRLYEDGAFWLAEVPVLDAMTQGRTREEALSMAEDLLESLANRPGFSVRVHPGNGDEFEVSSPDTRGLVSLLLRRQRERSGLSLAEAAERLGAKSRNAYARYERGTSTPTLSTPPSPPALSRSGALTTDGSVCHPQNRKSLGVCRVGISVGVRDKDSLV